MSIPDFRFNLWSEPWIRITRPDGSDAELSIADTLVQAHSLSALSDPSPLVVGGTQRLLAAILQAIYAPADLDALTDLIHAGQFDSARLAAFAATHADRFDLFHPTAPFLQTGDVPLDGWQKPGKGHKHAWSEAKSVAALLVEVPSATKRTLFHHVTDASHRFCPACCARGLITGIRPSINGVPPIYVFPVGDTLFASLALSLTVPDYQPATVAPERNNLAIWNGEAVIGKSQQVSAVGYLESLTFPARRTRLYPRGESAVCSQCGSATAVSVTALLSEMGHWLTEGSALWEDPFAAYRIPRSRAKSDAVDLKPVRPEEGKALWREYTSLLLAERDGQFRPRIVRQIANLIDRGVIAEQQIVRFRCIGLRTDGKAKIFEWLDDALEAPSALLTDDDAAPMVEAALQRAEDVRFILESTFNSFFRPERDRGGRDAKLARFQSLRARMLTDYWQHLALPFRQFVFDLGEPTTRDAVERAWVDRLIQTGNRRFRTAAESVGQQAEALRAQVEAQAACSARLNAKRKEWLGDDA
jgi:CRISPR system Cascade subunit CasA